MGFSYNCDGIDQKVLFSGLTPGDSTSKQASNRSCTSWYQRTGGRFFCNGGSNCHGIVCSSIIVGFKNIDGYDKENGL